jgi:thiosulfate reductase / polysulfide reductase chain A
MEKEIYSLCFMCPTRCPIKVTAKNDRVTFLEGNPHVTGMAGSLCPRGVSGAALLNDGQRVQQPMIRTGERGSGEWRHVEWDEALDYIVDKLKKIIDKHGARSIAFGERVQVSTHVSQAFMQAIGSPNHFTHDACCRGSNRTATNSLLGYTVTDLSPDYTHCRHIVLYGHNLLEAIKVKETKNLLAAIERGTKVTYIDPRVTVTATKAHRYMMIRPGTDLALNYALIHVIIAEKLYDADYVDRWVKGFSELTDFIQPYTPEWAAEETGIAAGEIRKLAREISADLPAVVFHFGHRAAHYENETYMRRSIGILNALMGSFETPGGYLFKKGPKEVGAKPARKLIDQALPAVDHIRFDKVGTAEFLLPDARFGVAQILPYAILNQDPYPIKALFVHRFEPLMSIPDSNENRRAFEQLDLIVTSDINFSDTAWYSDVILPEPIYLERTDAVQQVNGVKPQMYLARQAVSQRYNGREFPVVLKQLAERLGVGEFFPYTTMEDLVKWQLEGTGFTMADFNEKGFVSYTDKAILWDREKGIKFKTPSGRIEFVSSMLEEAGFESFPAYESVPSPPEGQFRLTVGRCALHTQVATQNNLYLNELMSENVLWINTERASAAGIKDGDTVEIVSKQGSGRIKAYLTDLIHPEAVFMLHGFGHEAKMAGRSCNRGVADGVLQENVTDRVGGSPALHHTFVRLNPGK